MTIVTLQSACGAPRANGRLQVENIENAIVGNLAPRFRDLLEIAAYVYLADTEVTRGAETDVFGTDWRRGFAS